MMKNDMTILKFCEQHQACDEGRKWALANCETMQDVWQNAKPEWLIWVATRKGVLTEKEQRLFACWAVRQVWHLLMDDRSRTAIEVAERFANGEATSEEMAAAWAAARDAAWAAWAARDAAWDAARAAAWAVAWAARDAARDAWAVAWAARDAARDAWAAQFTYLRKLTPNFERTV